LIKPADSGILYHENPRTIPLIFSRHGWGPTLRRAAVARLKYLRRCAPKVKGCFQLCSKELYKISCLTLYLRETLKDFGYQQNTATEIYKDDLAILAISENPVRRKFSRHIDIRRYFVRRLVKTEFVKLIPLRTHKMVADAHTKSLPWPAFIGHRVS